MGGNEKNIDFLELHGLDLECCECGAPRDKAFRLLDHRRFDV